MGRPEFMHNANIWTMEDQLLKLGQVLEEAIKLQNWVLVHDAIQTIEHMRDEIDSTIVGHGE